MSRLLPDGTAGGSSGPATWSTPRSTTAGVVPRRRAPTSPERRPAHDSTQNGGGDRGRTSADTTRRRGPLHPPAQQYLAAHTSQGLAAVLACHPAAALLPDLP